MSENKWANEVYDSVGYTSVDTDQNTTRVLRALVEVLEREKPRDAIKFIKNLTV